MQRCVTLFGGKKITIVAPVLFLCIMFLSICRQKKEGVEVSEVFFD